MTRFRYSVKRATIQIASKDYYLSSISCNNLFYYINTSEIPGGLSRVNMISSHVKMTCFFSQAKRLPLLWLHNPLKSTEMCCRMVETSSVLPQISSAIFEHRRQSSETVSENVWKRLSAFRQLSENLRISMESVRKSSINRQKSCH